MSPNRFAKTSFAGNQAVEEPAEFFNFDIGLRSAKSPLQMGDGELVSCEGWTFSQIGKLTPRSAKSLPTGANALDGDIIYFNRYINWLFAITDVGSVYVTWDMDKHCGHYTGGKTFVKVPNHMGSYADKPQIYSIEGIVFITSAAGNLGIIIKGDSQKNDFKIINATFSAPQMAPTMSVGAAGNPNGTYNCFYSYFITFPDGKTFESNLSPVATITAASEIINWANIQPCPYENLPNGTLVWRKLYRSVGGINYLVDTIKNNTTTTGADNTADATLQANSVAPDSDYVSLPLSKALMAHLHRAFFIDGNKLYFSDAYQPLKVKATSNIALGEEDEENVGLKVWGEHLYIPTKRRWFRLQGSDSATWVIKKPYTDSGVIAPYTMKLTKWGIIGLDRHGIFLFDGQTNKNISASILGPTYFDAISDYDACYAEYDGNKYYLYYNDGSNKCLVVDFTFQPSYRFYNDPYYKAHYFHSLTAQHYFGSGVYLYELGGTETISASLRTGDRTLGDTPSLHRKNLRYLFYDMNTAGKNVTITIYTDDNSWSKTVSTPSRQKNRIVLPNWDTYRIALGISCSNAQGIEIYSPWAVIAQIVGS